MGNEERRENPSLGYNDSGNEEGRCSPLSTADTSPSSPTQPLLPNPTRTACPSSTLPLEKSLRANPWKLGSRICCRWWSLLDLICPNKDALDRTQRQILDRLQSEFSQTYSSTTSSFKPPHDLDRMFIDPVYGRRLFYTSWIICLPPIEAVTLRLYDVAFMGICIFITSLFHWRKPRLGYRRALDLICVYLITAAHIVMAAFVSSIVAKSLFFSFTVAAIACYFRGRLCGNLGDHNTGSKWHRGVHILGTIANLILYPALAADRESVDFWAPKVRPHSTLLFISTVAVCGISIFVASRYKEPLSSTALRNNRRSNSCP